MAEEQPVEQRAPQWRPDVLGEEFEQLELPLGSDDEGEVVATLVRHRPRARAWFTWPWERRRGAASGADVLYVHGWSDYFFNPELARFWTDAGARFFALDLRKYGRSLRPGQTPGYITNLADYDADIEAALAAMGHGATDARRGIRSTADPARPLHRRTHAEPLGGAAPRPCRGARARQSVARVPGQPDRSRGADARDQLGCAHEPDGSDAERRPRLLHPNRLEGARRRVGVLAASGVPTAGSRCIRRGSRAILAGHATVAAGIDVGAPVLSLLSARSTIMPRWDPAMLTTDIVLVVDDIAQRSLMLGPEVAVARIDGALHDVFLSREPARAAAYASVTHWLRGYGPRS